MMLKQQNRWFGLVLATGWMLVAAGCGGKPMVVEGSVTLDGKPVETGTIGFVPADGKGPTMGGEIKGGKYQATGAAGTLPGKKTVSITAVSKTGKQIEAGPPAPAGTKVDELLRTSATESCEIVAGKAGPYDFALKSATK